VLDGAFTEWAGRTPVLCIPSTLKFMPAGERHCDDFDRGPVRGLLIEVEPDRLKALQPYGAVLDRRMHSCGGAPAEIALRLHAELCHMDSAAPLAIEGLMLELLATASRQPESVPRRSPPGWLQQVRCRIEEGVTGTLGVTEVANLVGVHPVTLARTFRRVYGCTMGEYVRRRRLERAMQQLRESNASLVSIALANGFADQSHFTNLFRRYTGVTPSAFRRRSPPP
jgi:AraC family transcriptional regulator